MEAQVFFSESQRFSQWWLYVIMIGVTLLIIAVNYAMFTARLETEIREDGIHLRYRPFKAKERVYKWEEIQRAYVRRYSPLFEYGGWGLKGFGDNKAWNVSGDSGIQLELRNGKKFLIGTLRPEEAEAALRRAGKLTVQ